MLATVLKTVFEEVERSWMLPGEDEGCVSLRVTSVMAAGMPRAESRVNVPGVDGKREIEIEGERGQKLRENQREVLR